MLAVKNMKRQFKSGWEINVAKALDKEHIEFDYEPGFFCVNSQIRYTPDFILKIRTCGKKVILEPHGLMDPLHFEKFAMFRKIYGAQYFLILIVKNDLIPFIPKDAYDDIWPIEFTSLLARKLKEHSPALQLAQA
jgi:hypothetical protein